MSTTATSAAAASPSAASPSAEAVRFPAGIPFIVGNEGAERFSFYGMRAILKTYLATTLFMYGVAPELAGEVAVKAASSRATAVTHLFFAGVYAFPMIGAVLADRLLGKYPVIFWLSLVYCSGHGVLALAGRFAEWQNWPLAEYGFYCGLALISIGSGGIKPCVSANVGDQFTDKNRSLVTVVFQIFYFIINFGSFFSTIITPLLMAKYGAEVAFGVPGIFMALATLVFWIGRKRFVRIPPKPGGKLGLLDSAVTVLFFSPVIAIIAAVFVVASDFEAPLRGRLTAGAFYGQYVREYLAFLAAHAWPFFLVSAALVAIGVGLFALRQRLQSDTGFVAMLFYALRHRGERKPGQSMFDVVREKYGDEAAEGPPAVMRIVVVFSMVSVFWALFDQHASTWITQAQSMNLILTVPVYTFKFVVYGTVALAAFGGFWLFSWISNVHISKKVTIGVGILWAVVGIGCAIGDAISGVWEQQALKPEQISALNPLFVMMIIPALGAFVYRPLEKRGITVKPLQKMTVGMFLAAVAFGTAAILQQRIEASPGDVPVLWQFVQYLIMTTAEVLVSVTGLEFAYTQAPRAMKSTMMGVWLLCVTFGNVLVAFLAPMEAILELSQFFWVFTGLMVVAALLFAILAYFYKGKSYLQGAPAH